MKITKKHLIGIALVFFVLSSLSNYIEGAQEIKNWLATLSIISIIIAVLKKDNPNQPEKKNTSEEKTTKQSD